MNERAAKPKDHAKTRRAVLRMYRLLAAVARRQTAQMLAAAKRIVEGRGNPADLKPVYAAELKQAVKHAMVAAFKEGRAEMRRKIALRLKSAPASVRELLAGDERLLAVVRELDADILQYREVARQYELWADKVIGGTLKRTVEKAREVIAQGIREGVPWEDYGWDKEVGRNTRAGLKSQLGEIFTDYETWQLRRVAITEHTRAVGLGNIYELDRDEMCVGGRWVVEYKGDPPCDQYRDNVYTTDVLRSIHPAHPNCQCTIDPVFEWENETVLEAA